MECAHVVVVVYMSQTCQIPQKLQFCKKVVYMYVTILNFLIGERKHEEQLHTYSTWLFVMVGIPSTGEAKIVGQASPLQSPIKPFIPPLHRKD